MKKYFVTCREALENKLLLQVCVNILYMVLVSSGCSKLDVCKLSVLREQIAYRVLFDMLETRVMFPKRILGSPTNYSKLFCVCD